MYSQTLNSHHYMAIFNPNCILNLTLILNLAPDHKKLLISSGQQVTTFLDFLYLRGHLEPTR